ncbi:MAG: BCAM0308 family protein [Syntrophotaleaceae bacterium]
MRNDPNIRAMRNEHKSTNSGKRNRVQTSTDPYIEEAGMPEPSRCTSCGAVYLNKRWYIDAHAASIQVEKIDRTVICPGCRKVQDGYAEGYVELSGDYLWQHEEEIRNNIRNEEKKAQDKNPLEKIISMERQGDLLVIETTEEKLAEHIGRSLNKAHQGDLKINWAEDHAICRVYWSRSH